MENGTGLILDGVFASQAIDSSGEILDIEGCDISTLAKDGLANYEHLDGGTKEAKSYGQEIVGRVIFAKKVFSISDCDTDREERYWDKVKVPFIYGMIRLYDGAGHEGAKALAAQIRDHHANEEQLLVRFSIEGSTLERDKDQPNRLTLSVARKVAITTRPCNRTCDSGLVSDPNAPTGFDKTPETDRHVLRLAGPDRPVEKTERLEHPLYTKLGGVHELESNPLIDEDSMEKLKLIAKASMLKALTAGSYAGAAPSALTGGSALQREDRGLKARAMAAVRDYGKKKFDKAEFRAFAKTYLPEADDHFLDHFIDIAGDYHAKRSTLAKKEGDAPKKTKVAAPKKAASSKKPAAKKPAKVEAVADEPDNLLAEEPKKATRAQLEFPPKEAGAAPAKTGSKNKPRDAEGYYLPHEGLPIRGEGVRPPEPLTLRGKPVPPPLHDKLHFDENTGILHVPPSKPGWRKKIDPETEEKYQEYSPGHAGGQFPMYIPGSDGKQHLDSFNHLLEHDAHINKFHDYAMENWAQMSEHFKNGTLPPEALMHAVLFAQLSPNTPVPMQELMYGHLVDSMKHNGIDARNPNFSTLRRDWLKRDKPNKLPDTSPEHWDRLGDQIRIGEDSKGAKRKPGELMSFMLANNKFDNMEQYHQLHKSLVDIVNKHKGNARAAAAELMAHKGFHDLKNPQKAYDQHRQKILAATGHDIGAVSPEMNIPGLAPKTTRYMLGMLGGGNVQVPDTHFTRYLFGLEKGKGERIDNHSIDAIKDQLWNERNGHVLDALDRYYAKHHPAVQHMVNHPKWGHLFQRPEDAIFPAFWKNWVSIIPHEDSRGLYTGGANEGTDHRVFWDNTIPLLGKSEDMDLGLAARTAMLHAKWTRDYGEIPAMMLYYHHLAPKLMAAAYAREVPKMVMKAEVLSIDLKKTLAEQETPKGDYSYQDKPVEFAGRHVIPGSAFTSKGKWALLHEDSTHYVAVPHENLYDFGPEHLAKFPKAKEGTHFWTIARPAVPVAELDK
jgi:hypothetical protein